MRISFFGDIRSKLGESPLWDWRCDCLWWVDAAERRVLGAGAEGRVIRDWRFDEPVGSIALAEGGLMAATGLGFALIDGEGRATSLSVPCAQHRGVRFNDGKADRSGRFVAGTMQLSGDADPASLWRLEPEGGATLLASDLRMANATCFSPDGRWLYHADTPTGIVRRRRYGTDDAPWEAFVDCRPLGSLPDGATVDAQGRVWVALVQAEAVACFSPEADLVTLVRTPLPFPSCPAFGGTDFGRLFVTTVSDSGLSLRTDHPDGGRVLVIDGLDATGIPEPICRATPGRPVDHETVDLRP